MFKDVPAGSHRVIFYCKAPAIDTPDPLYDLLTTGITQQPIMAFFVKDLYLSFDRRAERICIETKHDSELSLSPGLA